MVKLLGRITGPGKPPAPAPATEAVPVPQVIKEMGDFLEAALPTVERLTGVNRRELTFALLKGGLKGGTIDTILTSLMGKPPVAEAKFERQVKTLAKWVPVFCGLIGGVLIFLYFLIILMSRLLGALP